MVIGLSHDLLKNGVFLAKAAHKGEHIHPQGFFLVDDSSVQKTPETSSGFQARVYVSHEFQQVWIAIAGTNEWIDMFAWPVLVKA